jgi:hypothetical protein
MFLIKRTHYRLPFAIRVARHGLLPGLLLAGLLSNLYAVDGVILIDQNRALAGNVTPGDTAGFPVTITQPGSYRLSGNLTIPNGDTTAIQIVSSSVTIDLNGFSIIGPADCSGGFPCASAGIGSGIATPTSLPAFSNIAVRNGTIRGVGSFGIFTTANSVLVEDLHIRSNGDTGVLLTAANAIVRHNIIDLNGGSGIAANGLVTDNVVSRNFAFGIHLGVGTVARNVITSNGFVGMALSFANVSYTGNTLASNNNGGSQVSGGINLGQNLCGNAVCP